MEWQILEERFQLINQQTEFLLNNPVLVAGIQPVVDLELLEDHSAATKALGHPTNPDLELTLTTHYLNNDNAHFHNMTDFD
jgi:hypothetical protein